MSAMDFVRFGAMMNKTTQDEMKKREKQYNKR
jgi:hypothetical protein